MRETGTGQQVAQFHERMMIMMMMMMMMKKKKNKTTNYKRTEKTRHVRQLRENINITRQAMHV